MHFKNFGPHLGETARLCRCILDDVVHFSDGRDLQLRSVVSRLPVPAGQVRRTGCSATRRLQGLLVQTRASEKGHLAANSGLALEQLQEMVLQTLSLGAKSTIRPPKKSDFETDFLEVDGEGGRRCIRERRLAEPGKFDAQKTVLACISSTSCDRLPISHQCCKSPATADC